MRYLIAVLCAVAVISAQALYGGAMRPVFALPALLLLAVAGALALVAIVWRNVPAPSIPCVVSVMAFAGWLIWRTMESPDAWLAAGYLRLVVGCLVMYLIFGLLVTNPYHRLAFVCVLFLAAAIQASLAGLQFARMEAGTLFPWQSEQLRIWYAPKANLTGHVVNLRGRGTYLNGNHLVWFLNTAGLMALSLTCWGRWGLKVKILCLYVALASFAGSVVTLSRGGMLGLGAGLTVFLLLSALALALGARNRRLVSILVLAAATVVVASVGFLLFKNNFVVQQRFVELVSDTYRPSVFEAALRQAQIAPLLGTGAGTFLYFGRAYRAMTSFNDDVYVHNDWMQLLTDFGFPAVVLLLGVVWVHGVEGLRSLREVLQRRMAVHSRPQSHAAALLIGALACLAVFVVHSVFDFNMQIPANALLASAFLGMLANPGVAGITPSARGRAFFRRLACLVCAGCAVWLIALSLRAAGPEYFWLEAENSKLRGNLNEAKIFAEAGLRLGRHSRLNQTLGEVYLTAAMARGEGPGRREWARRAGEQFALCVEDCAMEGRNFLLLGEARWLEGRSREAERAVVESILRAPILGRGYERCGDFLADRGQWREARQAYLVAATLPGSLDSGRSAAMMAKKLLILGQ